ncbi:MAG: HNH endonuclease [Nitrosotalea sp.]
MFKVHEKGKIKLNVHHKISVKKGGTNNMRNLITVCQFCNRMLDSKRYSKLD